MSRIGLLAIVLLAAGCDEAGRDPAAPNINSLSVLSVNSLRARAYGATISIEQSVETPRGDSFLASYLSDELRVYTRIDVPTTPPPAEGFPVVIFLHGWVGTEQAPNYDLYFRSSKNYGEMIDSYLGAGFVVLVPGWRGHATIDGVAADGIEFMSAWDNGSYLSPVFYAIDVLNLIDGLASFKEARLDARRINLIGHSQGGDVALLCVAVAGEGSKLVNQIHAASIWSGTFPSRFTQLQTYYPMQKSVEAFLSGDGSWTSTAVGRDGSVNRNFVFGYPPDWIETINVSEWTWQEDTWSTPTVAQAVQVKLQQMYDAVNTYVGDINDAKFDLVVHEDGTFSTVHDDRIVSAMAGIGGFHHEEYLSEPLALQHSDRDFYSLPAWNADLCRRVNVAGGRCYDYEYEENTHALRVSPQRWMSTENAVEGFEIALSRDIALFRGTP